jgi:hypothetical protein
MGNAADFCFNKSGAFLACAMSSMLSTDSAISL